MDVDVEVLEASDWPDVLAIYTQGIETGDATFETEAPDWAEWDASHRADCRLVARGACRREVAGWAALSSVSDRCAYGGVAETSVYMASTMRVRGVGGALLRHLVAASEEPASGRCRRACFRRTNAASSSICRRDSESSGCASVSGAVTGRGGTPSCWSGEAAPSAPDRGRRGTVTTEGALVDEGHASPAARRGSAFHR